MCAGTQKTTYAKEWPPAGACCPASSEGRERTTADREKLPRVVFVAGRVLSGRASPSRPSAQRRPCPWRSSSLSSAFSRLSMEGVLRLLAVTEDRRSQRCICAWSPFRWGRGAVKPRSPRSGAPQAQGLMAPSRAQRTSHAANARNVWTPEPRRPILLWRTGDRVAKSRA